MKKEQRPSLRKVLDFIFTESDATRWKPLQWVCLYSTVQPRGLLVLILPPSCASHILTSCITRPFLSHNQIKVAEWNAVFISTVLSTCVTRLSRLLSLPNLIGRTLRFICKTASSQRSVFFLPETNVTVFFPFLQIFPDMPPLPETEQHLWPFPLHLTPHSSSPDQVSSAVYRWLKWCFCSGRTAQINYCILKGIRALRVHSTAKLVWRKFGHAHQLVRVLRFPLLPKYL